jgi:invasion protein IalB
LIDSQDSMKSCRKKIAFCIAVAVLMASAAIASAQQPPKPAPAQHPAAAAQPGGQPVLANEPQRTTATYGDWVVQCVANSAPPPDAICDMSQVTQVQGKNVPFSRVAVAHPDKGQPVKLIVQVPVNVSFATQVHIQTSDDDPGVIAPFANCNPNGCFAEFDLRDDLLKKLYGATSAGKMSFADAGNHAITVPMSFNGFSQAFDALSKK